MGSVGIISTIMKYLKDNYHYTFWNISIFSLETCWTETGEEGSLGIIIFVASEEDSETNFKDENENSQWIHNLQSLWKKGIAKQDMKYFPQR